MTGSFRFSALLAWFVTRIDSKKHKYKIKLFYSPRGLFRIGIGMYDKFSHPSGQCSRVAATCYALRADGQYMFALGNPGTQVKGTRGNRPTHRPNRLCRIDLNVIP